MRLWLLLFLTAMPLHVLAQRFDLGQLQKHASRYPAAAALRAHLAIEEREGLERCVKDARWKLKRAEDFFAAVRVTLRGRDDATYLVFAATFCPSYFGNGPAPYWIVLEESGHFRTLHFSTTEVVHICKSTSGGFRDIQEVSHAPESKGLSGSTVQYNEGRYGHQPLGRCLK